jgi:hypothetical protein
MGAVLATFAALDVRQFAPSIKMINLNFGGPRAGNGVFADYLMTVFPSGQYHRVVKLHDIVPHNPTPGQGFKHGGNEVWYNSPIPGDDSRIECENFPGEPENKHCSLSFAWAASVNDHRDYLSLPISFFCDDYDSPNPKPDDEEMLNFFMMNLQRERAGFLQTSK